MPVLVDATARTVLVDTDTRQVLFQAPGCSPPSGDCVHYISFQVKLTADDIANTFSDVCSLFTDLTFGSGLVLEVTDTDWFFQFFGSGGIDIPTSDVPLVADAYYDVLIAFSDPGYMSTDVDATLCINGISATTTYSKSGTPASLDLQDFYAGEAAFGGGDNQVDRRYRRIVISPGFDIATDTFDSLVNASVVVEDSENVLLANSGSSVGYGEVNVDWGMIRCTAGYGACCYGDYTCSYGGYADCIDAGGSYVGDGTSCYTGLCGTPPPPTGACCCIRDDDVLCCNDSMTADDCATLAHGFVNGCGWLEDATCDTTDCGGIGIPPYVTC